ncbi:MAG: HAMP domain-containing protein, partial [Gammaproteobacteria bacterium]|nr:HAMP domain-containing protein [Gammaproteobacteria bacterium]NIR26618.1 HAMP domain-containing protein [Gammaproteobacteria bacterium]NIR92531.1 HAMP domain-containing protein [Gammaproteobacteria bacterium]NIV02230.1 HAMP domain-containing protein [Phycisphaerae bacterium]
MFRATDQLKGKSSGNENARFAGAGLRARVTIAVVVPLVIILGLFTAVQYQRQRTMMLTNLSAVADYSARVVEENLLYQMQRADFGGLQILLDTINDREELESVFILSTDRRVVFSSEDTVLNIRLDDDAPACRPCHQLSIEERPKSVVVNNAAGLPVFRSMNLLENSADCVECHEDNDRFLGVLLTDIGMGPVPKSLNAQLRESLLWSAATILITILVVNLVLDRFVLGRLLMLTKAVDSIDGNRQLSLPVDTRADEIGKLTAAFRDMAHRIEKRQQENQLLSERLQTQSTQRGELLKRVIQAQEAERKRIARELHD